MLSQRFVNKAERVSEGWLFGQGSFSVYKTVSVGMSQSMSGELFATYSSSICYLFETSVAVVSPA